MAGCVAEGRRDVGVDTAPVVVCSENTEGEYSGIEHELVPGVTESLKIMTRKATLAIANYAFEFAYLNNRKKVTAVHKGASRTTSSLVSKKLLLLLLSHRRLCRRCRRCRHRRRCRCCRRCRCWSLSSLSSSSSPLSLR